MVKATVREFLEVIEVQLNCSLHIDVRFLMVLTHYGISAKAQRLI